MKTIKDKEYSFNHTKDRLRERFDLLLTRNEYELLCNICSSKDLLGDMCNSKTLVIKENSDQEIHTIFFKGRYIKFTFSTKKSCITTVLPEKRNK